MECRTHKNAFLKTFKLLIALNVRAQCMWDIMVFYDFYYFTKIYAIKNMLQALMYLYFFYNTLYSYMKVYGYRYLLIIKPLDTNAIRYTIKTK